MAREVERERQRRREQRRRKRREEERDGGDDHELDEHQVVQTEQALRNLGVEPAPDSPREFGDYIRSETIKWAKGAASTMTVKRWRGASKSTSQRSLIFWVRAMVTAAHEKAGIAPPAE